MSAAGEARCALLGESRDAFGVVAGAAQIALHVALAAPERVSRLVLVSCSPGIEHDGERAERRIADNDLAGQLERIPFEQFIEQWRTQALFADDPPDVRERAREDQMRNEPRALAKAMRGLGTGEMASLWARLGELTMPVTVLVGERDAKFRAIGERMVALMPDARLVVIPGGHALPLESPDQLVHELD